MKQNMLNKVKSASGGKTLLLITAAIIFNILSLPFGESWSGASCFAQFPGWQWAKQGAGTGFGETGYAITTDAITGDVYVTGSFQSTTVTFGSTTLTNAGGNWNDVFVVKYNAAGTVLWATSAGSNNHSYGCGISTDANGNAYVTGYFASATINFGSVTLTNTGAAWSYDMFVVKYNSAGTVLWAKNVGGTDREIGRGISTDANGNSYITGEFSSDMITFGSTTLTNIGVVGYSDIFIVKYNSSGTVLWAINAGGTENDIGFGINIDATTGDVYATGTFYSTTTFGSITLTNASGYDVFVVKYNSAGAVQWATSAGGGNDFGLAITTDAAGNVYATGVFASATINFGSVTLTNNAIAGTGDIYVVKYNSAGTVLWATSAGGINNDYGYGISTDATTGDVYVTGAFRSPTLTFGSTTLTNATSGSYDIYVVKYNAAGTVLWATSAGGTGWDFGYGISTNATTGDTYATGYFEGATITFSGTTLTSADGDMFVAKIGAALPIELLSFTGKNKGEENILKWTTASEMNNDYFIVERRSEGESESEWEEIGKVNGASNSNTIKNYEFTDTQYPILNTQYYRLKQTDYDGNFTYSQTIAITMGQFHNGAINIYPNPAKESLQLAIDNSQKTNGTIGVVICDVLGREVYKTTNYKLPTTNSIDISALTNGMYFLKVNNGTEQTQAKFVKE